MPQRSALDRRSWEGTGRAVPLRTRMLDTIRRRDRRALNIVGVACGVVILSATFASVATGAPGPGGPGGADDSATGTAAPVAAAAPQNPGPVSRKGPGPRPQPNITAN